MSDPCHWCDRPAEAHPRYIALLGVHDWVPRRRLSDPPTAVPHPLGGITYPVDPSQAAQWWEDTDPDPVPGGGDRLPGHGKTRPLQREPGGLSTQHTAIDDYQVASNELHHTEPNRKASS